MKKIIGLLAAAAILVSCSNATEQRKLEIDQKIKKLQTEIRRYGTEKNRLKKEFERAVMTYESLAASNLSETERQTKQLEFEHEIRSIELQQQALEKHHIMTQLQINRLEIEYAQL